MDVALALRFASSTLALGLRVFFRPLRPRLLGGFSFLTLTLPGAGDLRGLFVLREIGAGDDGSTISIGGLNTCEGGSYGTGSTERRPGRR